MPNPWDNPADVYKPTPGWTPPPPTNVEPVVPQPPVDPCNNPYAQSVECGVLVAAARDEEPTPTAVPEPGSAVLLGLALVAMWRRVTGR